MAGLGEGGVSQVDRQGDEAGGGGKGVEPPGLTVLARRFFWGGKHGEQSLIETFPRERVVGGALRLPVNPALTGGLCRNQEVTDELAECNI